MDTPRYAVLGATGNCGRALIANLIAKPTAQVNAYCRSRSKLLGLFPDLKAGRTEIFEGSIQDDELLASCVRDCRAIFLCISTNDNVPGCRMAQDTTKAVIKTLRGQSTVPTVVLLSSGTVDERFRRNMPSILLWVLLRSAYHVYQDILDAEKLLRAEADWLPSIYVKPAMLAIDAQRGHSLSFTDQDEHPLSYLDLAAGMIEAVDDEGSRYVGRNVSVVNTGGMAKFPSGTPLCVLVGLLIYYFPFLYAYLPKNTGPR